jgi:3'-5' exoribonuclease
MAKLAEPLPKDLVVRLKHMILSHHGTYEFGSPKIPMTPEAMLLHEIDSLDTRMHMVLRDIQDDKISSSAWTPYNPTLARRFYKGGGTGEFYSASTEAFD